MDTDSYIKYIKAKDVYQDIADDAQKLFNTSNSIKRPLPIGKNKK